MREVTKTTRFAHKKDLWTYVQGKMDHGTFNAALDALTNDGVIYTAIDDDQFGLTE